MRPVCDVRGSYYGGGAPGAQSESRRVLLTARRACEVCPFASIRFDDNFSSYFAITFNNMVNVVNGNPIIIGNLK